MFNKVNQYINLEIPNILDYIHEMIYSMVFSPDNPGTDINVLTQEKKDKISQKAIEHYKISQKAISFEISFEHEKAINEWRKIFGENFPLYG